MLNQYTILIIIIIIIIIINAHLIFKNIHIFWKRERERERENGKPFSMKLNQNGDKENKVNQNAQKFETYSKKQSESTVENRLDYVTLNDIITVI